MENFRYFNSDDDFRLALARINALGSPYSTWNLTQARKTHTDEFGQVIETGEHYYKKSSGPAYHNEVKLSEKSMDYFAYLFFLQAPGLEKFADKVINKQQQELIDAMDGFKL